MKKYSYVVTGSSIVVTAPGVCVTVAETASNYKDLKNAIDSKDWDAVEKHLNPQGSVEAWGKGRFKFEGSDILFKIIEGKYEKLPDEIKSRMLQMKSEGKDPEPLMKFWEKLQKNPSWRSVEQLFPFLKHEGIPILENGNFLAYKGVNTNYTDKHTGTVDNKPGAVNEMPRNKVSDDPKTACHYGYHVGALSYAKSFGAVVVVCEVDPRDVVCIPYDCGQQKMRVCKYRVVGNYSGDLLPSTTYELEEIGTGSEVLPMGDEEDIQTEEHCKNWPEGATHHVCEECDPETIKRLNEKQDAKKPVERKMKKKREADKKVTLKVPKKYEEIHEMKLAALIKQPRASLDEYATKVLHMTGASKVKTRTELASQIMKVRKNFA